MIEAPPSPTQTAPIEAETGPAGLLQVLLDSMHHGIALYDRQGRLVAANRLAVRYAGLGEEATRPGTTLAEHIAAQAAAGEYGTGETAATTYALALAHDRSQPSRYIRTRPDGTVLEITSDPTPDGGFVLTHTDITGRAAAEAELREQAALLRATLDALHHGVAVYGPDRRLRFANALAAELTGLPPGSIRPGRLLDEVIAELLAHGEFGTTEEHRLALDALTYDRSRPRAQTRVKPDGRVLDVRSVPMPDGGFIITHIDITRVLAAEGEAKRRAQLLQTMQETMHHGIALFGPDRRLVIANDLAIELAGLTPDEMHPGMSIGEIVAIQFSRGAFGEGAEALAAFRDASGHDRSTTHRMRRHLRDGRIVDSRSDPTPDGGFVKTWTDVTALVRAEAAAEHRAATLQAMLENMRNGVALFDRDHRLVAANRLIAELGGIPSEALRPGTPLDAMIDAQCAANASGDRALDAQFAAQARTADRSLPLRYTRPSRDGRMLDIASDPMPDGGFVITIADVTALARAEAEARRRGEVQQTMLQAMRHGIALYDANHRLVAVNRVTDPTGLVPVPNDPAEAPVWPGMSYEEVIRYQASIGGLGPDPEEEVQRLLALDRSLPHRYLRRGASGRLIDVHSDPTPDGGFAITFTDVTLLAAAEEAAESRAAMLRAALDHMRHGILLFGPDRRLLASNALAMEIGGLAPEELEPGTLLDDQLRSQHARGMYGEGPKADEILAGLLSVNRDKSWLRTRRMPDDRVVEVYSDPTPDGGFVVTFSDVTARALAETNARQRATLLRTTLDNMRHGIALYGPDRRLVLANRLAASFNGMPDFDTRIGSRLEELVREQQERGQFGPEAEASRIADAVIAQDRSRSYHYQRRIPDGRVLDIGSDPMPDGGFVITHTDITELEAAKAEASDRAALLQVMLDNIRHGITYFGPDRRLIAFNHLAEELIGPKGEPLRPGMSLAELGASQEAEGALGTPEETAAILKMRERDRSEPFRYLRRTPEGRILEISSNPVPKGGFVATHTDVTELMQAQSSAADRAALLQLMLDSMRHGIALFDAQRCVVAANALADRLNGLPTGAHRPGRPIEEILAEAAAGGVLGPEAAAILRSLDFSQPQQRSLRRPDGQVIELISDPTPQGGFVVTLTDVTALARAEQEARSRAAMLQAMLDNSRQGIVLFDTEGRVLAANGIAAQLNGLPVEMIHSGMPIQTLIRVQAENGVFDPAGLEEALALVPTDRPWPVPYSRRRTMPDGSTMVVTTDSVGGVGYIRSYRDITEELNSQRELERARDAAEAANRAKSRFLATMSHELRTPLNSVIGFSEAYQFDRDPARRDEYIQSIREAGRHLLSLIDDILDVTRSETTGFTVTEGEVDAVATGEGAVQMMQATAATAGVTVQAALPPRLPRVRADALRLRQVLLNLLANAVKFTPAGGSVILDAALEPGGDLVLRVTDTGIGIAAADIPRAFEPFTQLDSSLSRRFPGSGLGLYLSRALAEAQGATLTLESIPGAGTTAVLRFPPSRLLAD
ncbi:PAS-domain containing protein [Belnapia sp. T6]|uniref:histidine kinase n=1 Tax=Belnapia mucosa TaxID=2804532 RepID=A0ABS1V9E0_9PROT|nr:PAS-domain containing protein [Belnapia mucosa]MBL6458279.1 PAS-domain containing protein [Belnapia mucosa]